MEVCREGSGADATPCVEHTPGHHDNYCCHCFHHHYDHHHHYYYYDWHRFYPSWCYSFGFSFGYDYGFVFCDDGFTYWYVRYPGYRARYYPYYSYYAPEVHYVPYTAAVVEFRNGRVASWEREKR